MLACPSECAASVNHLHDQFLSILPRIKCHGNVYFRHLRGDNRDEAIAEMIALSWKWFVRLSHRGKDVTQFASTLASYAARAVNNGRRLCGQEGAKDALSERAQQRHGFSVGRLPDYSTLASGPYEDALAENTVSAVPDQAAFRIDFPTWLGSRSERDRRIIGEMALNERTTDLSRRFGLSPARISQLRGQFHRHWLTFLEELPRADHPVPAVA